MDEKGDRIIRLIRESNDPEKAMQIALKSLIRLVAEHCPGMEVSA